MAWPAIPDAKSYMRGATLLWEGKGGGGSTLVKTSHSDVSYPYAQNHTKLEVGSIAGKED